MAEIIKSGGYMVIVKDWEKLLTMFSANAVRISELGEIEFLVEGVWRNVTEYAAKQAADKQPRFPPNDPRAQEGGKATYVADPNSPPFMNNDDTKL